MARKRRTDSEDPSKIAEERAARRPQLQRQLAQAKRVLNKHRRRLLARKGVTGIDVGFKLKGEALVRPLRYVIRVHVEVKLGEDLLPLRSRLPKSIESVGIDVLERRYLSSAKQKLKSEWSKFHDPIPGGCAISCDQGQSVGTLGMKVISKGQPRYLTNAHVAVSAGNSVWQPPLSGAGVPTDATRVIGSVVKPLLRNLTVDCALIRPSGERLPAGTILGISPSASMTVRRLDRDDEHTTRLFKIGATTGSDPQLLGTVDNVEAETIDGDHHFADQITVRMKSPGLFCAEGDSGAILFGKQVNGDLEIVGLVHASTFDGRTAVACHFDAVMTALKFEL